MMSACIVTSRSVTISGPRAGAVKRVLHWFRRDLRLHDNTALSEAFRRSEEIVPVFIVEESCRIGPDVGAARLAFLLRSVAELRDRLAELGYALIVRCGRAEQEIPRLARELHADAVFCNARYEPYAQRRDNRVFAALNEIRVGFESFKDAVVWHEDEVLTKGGTPFTVFTPYANAWKQRGVPAPRPPVGRNPNHALRDIASEPLPLDPAELGHPCTQTIPAAGERAAHAALDQFCEHAVFTYATSRNRVDIDGTSKLSPHFRAGTIGVRTVLQRLAKARAGVVAPPRAAHRGGAVVADGLAGCDAFLTELIWREFYLQVLHNFPHVSRGAFRPEFNNVEWQGGTPELDAWCEARTGYPLVDAAMRCLNATGWMHNRLRMIVAMFLTKDLLVDWRSGERYFMRQLVDGDLAANNGGWQWSAGTGTDAAPYFRIFNPVSQGEKFDPRGEFVRRWVPELASLPLEIIHQPWKDPLACTQTRYPARIVFHEAQRLKCLAMFDAVKRTPAL